MENARKRLGSNRADRQVVCRNLLLVPNVCRVENLRIHDLMQPQAFDPYLLAFNLLCRIAIFSWDLCLVSELERPRLLDLFIHMYICAFHRGFFFAFFQISLELGILIFGFGP